MGSVLIQYGCIAHCTLEFVGDFVVVSINEISKTVTADNVVTIGHLLKHIKNESVIVYVKRGNAYQVFILLTYISVVSCVHLVCSHTP